MCVEGLGRVGRVWAVQVEGWALLLSCTSYCLAMQFLVSVVGVLLYCGGGWGLCVCVCV